MRRIFYILIIISFLLCITLVYAADWTLTDRETELRAEGEVLLAEFIELAQPILSSRYDDPSFDRDSEVFYYGMEFSNKQRVVFEKRIFTEEFFDTYLADMDRNYPYTLEPFECFILKFYYHPAAVITGTSAATHFSSEYAFLERMYRSSFRKAPFERWKKQNPDDEKLQTDVTNFQIGIDNLLRFQYRYFKATGDIYNFLTKDSFLKRNDADAGIDVDLLKMLKEQERIAREEDRLFNRVLNNDTDIDESISELIENAQNTINDDVSEENLPPLINPVPQENENDTPEEPAAPPNKESFIRRILNALGNGIWSFLLAGIAFGAVWIMRKRRNKDDIIDLDLDDDE